MPFNLWLTYSIMNMKELKGCTLKEIQDFVESLGEKKFRGTQIYKWIYGKYAQNFEVMSDISRNFKSVLSQTAKISNLSIASTKKSQDGSIKFLFKLDDNLFIESVLIPAFDKRLTLCISTQVGCLLGCKFCATGYMGFQRNLTTGEIVDQLIQVQKTCDERITNIVLMGMGEPLQNYENVIKAVKIINDGDGLKIGARHITLSTAGCADKIYQLAEEKIQFKLAISLNSMDNSKRTEIMPITNKYPVNVLLDAVRYYYEKTRRRPTFEYILFEGFNDSVDDVKALIQLGKRIPCKINLIAYNPIDFILPESKELSFKPAPDPRIELFADALRRGGLTVMIRKSLGRDINGACGQLAISKKQKEGEF